MTWSSALWGPWRRHFRCCTPITGETHTRNMHAAFSGTRLRPAVELNFSFYATHPVTGQPLREWIRDIPGRAWVPERKMWTVTALGPTPDKTLTDAGFTTVGPDDELMSLAGYTAPLVTVDPEHPGFLCVYPRLAGQFHAAPQLPATAIWRADETRWLVSVHDLPGGVPKEFALTTEAAAALDAAQTTPTTPDPARDLLLYDGTLDGLRGVPVTDLRNVDRATATAMSKLDITSVYDLVHHVPRRYIDRSNPTLITAASVGCKIAVLGTVDGVTSAKTRAGSMSKVTVRDTAGTAVFCTWFNAAWITRRFTKGDLVVLHARLDTWTGKGGVEHFGMNNPLMDKVEPTTAVMVPVYPASAKAEISTWALHRAGAEAVARMGEISDPIPAPVLAERNLLDRTQAYTGIHLPTDPANAEAARRRLAYDELLALQLTLRNRRDAEGPEGSAAVAHTPTRHLANQLIASLPFELTAAQRRVLNEVARDMRATTPMHRMIQGEVGSGKNNNDPDSDAPGGGIRAPRRDHGAHRNPRHPTPPRGPDQDGRAHQSRRDTGAHRVAHQQSHRSRPSGGTGRPRRRQHRHRHRHPRPARPGGHLRVTELGRHRRTAPLRCGTARDAAPQRTRRADTGHAGGHRHPHPPHRGHEHLR